MKLNQNIFRFRKRNAQIQQKQNESEKLLRNFAFLDLKDLFDHFSVSGSGLTAKQAEQLQEEYGKNIITTGQSNTTLHRLVNAVVNPFNIVLLIIAVITLFTDVIYSQHPDYVTVCIILFLVIVSSLVAFIQGERSNSAAEKLSKMISNKADVLRDGVQTEIPIEDVVPGDMVRLSAGDMIPADIRFVFTICRSRLPYRGIESGRKIRGYPFRQGRRADRPSKHRFYGYQHGKRQCNRHRPCHKQRNLFWLHGEIPVRRPGKKQF